MKKDLSSIHIPAIDGLRGIAILWVIFHNAALEGTLNNEHLITKLLSLSSSMGWLGVQLFFVLSGFLITGILLDAKNRHEKKIFKQFYIRRALRIFPIYYFFLFICFLTAINLNEAPSWLSNAYNHKWWHIFYLNNWIQPFEDIGLSHLWSLAVEEQFYLLWPFAILLIPNKYIYLVCIFLIVLSPIYRLIITSIDLEFAKLAAYVPTIARIDALVIGALLAIIIRNHTIEIIDKIMKIILSISSTYLAFVFLTNFNITRVSEGILNLNQTICAFFFASMLFYATKQIPKNKFQRVYINLLLSPCLRSFGKYSYAMYLFHLPISLVFHDKISNKLLTHFGFSEPYILSFVFLIDMTIIILMSYFASRLSWVLIEKHFLRLKRHFPMNSST